MLRVGGLPGGFGSKSIYCFVRLPKGGPYVVLSFYTSVLMCELLSGPHKVIRCWIVGCHLLNVSCVFYTESKRAKFSCDFRPMSLSL